MKKIIASPPKHSAVLAKEWDALANERHRQITAGEDISYEKVLVPEMLSMLRSADTTSLLDVGSGTGDFTRLLANIAEEVVGVEPSSENIAISKKVCAKSRNVSFINLPIEAALEPLSKYRFTSSVAMMSLMSIPDLKATSIILGEILATGSTLIAVITHPCFWPIYWKYAEEEWFDYSREIFIEAPFSISKTATEIKTTHIHRPISFYVNVFAEAGFRLEQLSEPIPSDEVRQLYPTKSTWPRFLGFRWVKV